MISLNPQSIRIRLTVWHLLVFGGILVLFATGTAAFLVVALDRQMDASLKEDLEIVQQLLSRSAEGSFTFDSHPNPVSTLERFMEIWSADGRLLFRSSLLGARTLGNAPDTAGLSDGAVIRSIELPDSSRWRVATAAAAPHGRPLVVRLAVSEGEFYSDIRTFVTVLLTGVPLGLLLVIVSGYMLSRAALRPIDVMAGRAKRISVRNLKDRIPVKNAKDELGRLAIAFNDLLQRLEGSFEEMERFTADASHELRTPLTALRSVGEVGIQGVRAPEEYREIIGSMLEEIGRLTKLVENLLFLSRADGRRHELTYGNVDLLSLARETAGLIGILAEEKEQVLTVTGEADVIVHADRSVLGQAVMNLIDNAIKFSPGRTAIDVNVRHGKQAQAWLEVIDHGPGIPPSQRTRIFERFYRLHRSRDGAPGGVGLGLAIAKWAVEANGGEIMVEDTKGRGTTFRIVLPLARPSS